MQFEKIEIKNFRGYYAENLLEFSNNENKPLTMVVGNQGGGKSSLMEAIQWCLYGEDIKQLRHVEAEGPAEVALTFTHEKKKYNKLLVPSVFYNFKSRNFSLLNFKTKHGAHLVKTMFSRCSWIHV